jgi:MBG domain (YGX type)
VFTFAQAPTNATALAVTPAPLTVTYTASASNRLYGNANPTLSGTQNISGLVNGDTLTGVTNGTVNYTTTATAASNIGNYAITGSGLSGASANYNFTFAQAASNLTALSVTPRPLSVTANALTRLYGAANPTLTYGAVGLVNGDTLSGALSTTALQTSPSGDYPILQGTLVASPNYRLSFNGALLTIKLPPLQSLNSFLKPVELTSDVATQPVPDQPNLCQPTGISASLRAGDTVPIDVLPQGTNCAP